MRPMRPGSVMMQLGLMDVFTWHVRDLQGVQLVNAVWTLTEIYIAVEGDTLIAAAVTDTSLKRAMCAVRGNNMAPSNAALFEHA